MRIRIIKLHEEASRCEERRLPEPSWNEYVHSTILSLVLRGYWMSKGIEFYNITTARIYDPWLPPQVNNITMESKMVDYALVIEPGVEMGLRIKKKRLAETKPSKLPASINHTAAEFMRFNPIGINRTHSLK